MLKEERKIIVKKLELLVKCDVEALARRLQDESVFSQDEIGAIFKSSNDRHNRRLLFISILDKTSEDFQKLVRCLKDIEEPTLARSLEYHRLGAMPISWTNSEIGEVPHTPISRCRSDKLALNINVARSNEFYDTEDHNDEHKFYATRSKTRGEVLIINNHRFDPGDVREGADVDDRNLINLFMQLQCQYELHVNLTADKMKAVVEHFVRGEPSQADICFVVIMSHGTSIQNETCIFGSDKKHIPITEIHDIFSKKQCTKFDGKPKVFLYQVCRGTKTNTQGKTTVDGMQYFTFDFPKISPKLKKRLHDDMFIGYATVDGFTAHRDPENGTWYIEAFCRIVSQFAHKYNFRDLMQLVDQELENKVSEDNARQTSEIVLKGFKRLYLNPGIYMENGVMKHFDFKKEEDIKETMNQIVANVKELYFNPAIYLQNGGMVHYLQAE